MRAGDSTIRYVLSMAFDVSNHVIKDRVKTGRTKALATRND